MWPSVHWFAAEAQPTEKSFMANTGANLILPVVKRCEDGEGFILRMTEVYGQPATDTIGGDVETIRLVKPMENGQPVGGDTALNFKPFEIKTVAAKINAQS